MKKKIISNFRSHQARIVDIKFSPDDKVLATSSYDQTVALWDVTDFNAQPIKLKEHESWVLAVAFNSPGNKMVSGSSKEERLILWPTKTNEMAALVYKNINRNFTQNEWNTYIGKDINYEKTK